jgi:hypothetical protein
MNLRRLLGLGARKAARLAADDSMRKQYARLEVENDTLRAERDYWKRKAEALIDAALAKAGHTPVMARDTLGNEALGFQQPFAGLAVTTVNRVPTTPREAAK